MKIRTEVVLEVILLVLTEINVQIVQTAIIMTMVEIQTETIAHIGLEIATVEEMAMIGLPPLWKRPYLIRKTKYTRSKSAFDHRGY
jgi:hypothetical protein